MAVKILSTAAETDEKGAFHGLHPLVNRDLKRIKKRNLVDEIGT